MKTRWTRRSAEQLSDGRLARRSALPDEADLAESHRVADTSQNHLGRTKGRSENLGDRGSVDREGGSEQVPPICVQERHTNERRVTSDRPGQRSQRADTDDGNAQSEREALGGRETHAKAREAPWPDADADQRKVFAGDAGIGHRDLDVIEQVLRMTARGSPAHGAARNALTRDDHHAVGGRGVDTESRHGLLDAPLPAD